MKNEKVVIDLAEACEEFVTDDIRSIFADVPEPQCANMICGYYKKDLEDPVYIKEYQRDGYYITVYRCPFCKKKFNYKEKM